MVAEKYRATSTATSTFAGGVDAARVCLTGTTTCLGASVVSGNSFAFPFDPVTGGNATSTNLYLYGGFYTAASSTINSTLNLTGNITNPTGLNSGNVYINDALQLGGNFAMPNLGVIGWNNNAFTITHSTGLLTFAGGALNFSSSTNNDRLLTGILLATSTATSTFNGGVDVARICITGTTKCLNTDLTASSTLLTDNNSWLGTNNFPTNILIPNSAAPSLSNVGQITINTTQASTSLRYYDGTATRALFPTTDKTFIIASSTLSAFKGLGATSTISWGVALHSETWLEAGCYASTTGSGGLQFTDNTGNKMEYVPVSSAPTLVTLATNNSYIRGEARSLDIRAETSLTQDISCTVTVRRDAD